MRMLSQPFSGAMSTRPSAVVVSTFPVDLQVSVTSGTGARVAWSRKVTDWACRLMEMTHRVADKATVLLLNQREDSDVR